MGMYTELHLSFALKKDTPDVVLNTLSKMVMESDFRKFEFNYVDFKTARSEIMFKCSSYYFIPFSVSMLKYDKISKQYYLLVHSNFKNYEDDINLFLLYINKYIESRGNDKTFIGYSRLEEADEPTLYYKK